MSPHQRRDNSQKLRATLALHTTAVRPCFKNCLGATKPTTGYMLAKWATRDAHSKIFTHRAKPQQKDSGRIPTIPIVLCLTMVQESPRLRPPQPLPRRCVESLTHKLPIQIPAAAGPSGHPSPGSETSGRGDNGYNYVHPCTHPASTSICNPGRTRPGGQSSRSMEDRRCPRPFCSPRQQE